MRRGDAAQRRIGARAQCHAVLRGSRAQRGERTARESGQATACLLPRDGAQCDVAALRGQRKIALQGGGRAIDAERVARDQRLRAARQHAARHFQRP
ncbi:hypothetical protein AL520_29995 [Achromobacter xylosoxidans]|nr:hypothetical protein AL520_29995 [Achromobacter xylosoxidans]